MPGARHPRRKPYNHEEDAGLDLGVSELDPSSDAPAPPTTVRFRVESITPAIYAVRDKLTDTLREVTHDPGDAMAIATHLERGGIYSLGFRVPFPA